MSDIFKCLDGGVGLIGNTPTNLALDTLDLGTAVKIPTHLTCFGLLAQFYNFDVPAGDTLEAEYYYEEADAPTGPWEVIPEYVNCPETCVVAAAEAGEPINSGHKAVYLPVKCFNKEYVRLAITLRSANGGATMQTIRFIPTGETLVANDKRPVNAGDL